MSDAALIVGALMPKITKIEKSLYLEDLNIFGKEGYVYKSESLVKELIENSDIAFLSSVSRSLLLDATLEYNTFVGMYFEKLTADETGAFNGLDTLDQVISNENALNMILNNDDVFTMVWETDLIIDSIINNESAMNIVANNSTFMEKITLEPDTYLTKFFETWIAKEAFWDNVDASNALMTTVSSRTWMINNVSITTTYSKTGGTAGVHYSSSYSAKAFGLSLKMTQKDAMLRACWKTPERFNAYNNSDWISYNDRLTNIQIGFQITASFSGTFSSEALWVQMAE